MLCVKGIHNLYFYHKLPNPSLILPYILFNNCVRVMVFMLKTMRQLYSKNRFTGIDKLNRNRTMCIANYYQYAVDIWSSKRDGVYYFIIQAFGTAKVDF